MNRVIAQLCREHREMGQVLSVVEATLAQVRAAGPADYELLRAAAYYLSEYPELFHHVKEDLVYRYLRRRRPGARRLVDELETEHERLRRLGLAFLEITEDAVEGLMVSREAIARLGAEYLDTERRHMRREEQEVFPLVERTLLAADWLEIRQALSPHGARGLRPITRERFAALRAHIDA